ncbi:MAG: protein-L-isoaspartate(D-aspartate) O-methyltransferase [Anaerolineales bacterium]
MESYQVERDRMVDFQIISRGIKDPQVISAMRKVPRHLFLPKESWPYAYVDSPVRIGCGQTISQPYIVALMTELLKVESNHHVLDIGTGSGYQAAVLGEIAAKVDSIERHPELAQLAEERLQALGYNNVSVHVGDGTKGFPPNAPYDRIIVAAAAPSVPDALLDQLAEEGRLVIPVGKRFSQQLEVWDRKGNRFKKSTDIPVIFVPLIGDSGWDS